MVWTIILFQVCLSNHHHHHVVPLARISLTLSRHFSLSFIASCRSSGLHSVSSHSCWMCVQAVRPAFARTYVGVHRSTSHSYLILIIYTHLYGFKYSYLILIIYTQFYGFKYSYLILIIYTHLYGFKYCYLILIIYTHLYGFKYSYLILIIYTHLYGFKYCYLILIIYTHLYGFKYSYLILIIYVFLTGSLANWVEYSRMIRETWLQFQVASYQRHKKWYLIPPCLTLSNIRYVSRVKWTNSRKGVVPSPTLKWGSCWNGSLLVTLDYGRQLG